MTDYEAREDTKKSDLQEDAKIGRGLIRVVPSWRIHYEPAKRISAPGQS